MEKEIKEILERYNVEQFEADGITKELLNLHSVSVPLPVLEQVLKYCEHNQIYDKLGSYGNFYYKLNQIKREIDS